MSADPDLEVLAVELAALSKALRSASLAAGRAAGAVHRRRAADACTQLELDLGPGV